MRIVFLISFLLCGSVVAKDKKEDKKKEIVVYSSRKAHLIEPVFKKYTEKTGVAVKFLTDKEGPLIERIKAEGKRTSADIFITVDAGNLWLAEKEGLFRKVKSKVLNENIPSFLKSPNNKWFGLSVRARTIVYNTKNVQSTDLSTYEDLASEQWKGRLCLRTSRKVYNQSLVAMMMERLGKKKTEEIVKGWVRNLATDVFSNDTKMMEAIAAGQCDVGIGNTYYYGRLLREKPKLQMALFWPNQKTSGVHVNVSGAGVLKHSKNKKEAIHLLEWMSSEEGQRLFADLNLEYPANQSVEPHKMVKDWGQFKSDRINVSKAGKLQGKAIQLMDRAGYK